MISIKFSQDGKTWQTLAVSSPNEKLGQFAPRTAQFDVDGLGRYVRVEFYELTGGAWASIRELGVYTERAESDYYDPMYDYRLRWDDVIYEPGELKVVAYRDGKRLGEAVRRTAGAPAALRLTPDRTQLAANGDDLCYVLVEAVDAAGEPCPLADNQVKFNVQGPATIAGVGNGNPISYEPFQADSRQLFNGKAMLILRAQPGDGGAIRVTATSDGLAAANAECAATPASPGRD